MSIPCCARLASTAVLKMTEMVSEADKVSSKSETSIPILLVTARSGAAIVCIDLEPSAEHANT